MPLRAKRRPEEYGLPACTCPPIQSNCFILKQFADNFLYEMMEAGLVGYVESLYLTFIQGQKHN